MTLGMSPEALVLGYLKNQHLIESMDELLSIKVNWDTEKALGDRCRPCGHPFGIFNLFL
jgi:formate dehydrogenase assembly factor FdhD